MATNTIKKSSKGYNYKYADMAGVHDYLEEMGYTYYQYIERVGDDDYIYTVPTIDGVEKAPRRGCRVPQAVLRDKSNPAQEYGSALTYARRYSLFMAFGLATSDDDAQCLTKEADVLPIINEPKETRKKTNPAPKVEAEVVKEEPEQRPSIPSREAMIKVVYKHYPVGTATYNSILGFFGTDSVEDASDAQLLAIYNKFGGK